MITAHRKLAVFFVSALVIPIFATVGLANDYRATDGLQVLYTFAESDGNVIKDVAGIGQPLNLHIADVKTVKRSEGSLLILKPTGITSQKPPGRLISAIQQSNEISIEVWCQPLNTKQAGPARLVTVSKDSSNRNVTLGQDANKFEVRLRTTKTSTNGIPSVPSPGSSVTTNLTHVVYTRAKNGTARIYINGKQVVESQVAGEMSNWDQSYQLSLVDELSGGRPWLGSLHLVAIYSRALAGKDVPRNFLAGPKGKPSPELIAERKHKAAATHFETKVAPLLAKHCLECHDTASHANGLDLSKKRAAFSGGANGKSIIPGKSADSELWLAVEADAMPHERPPLSADEKAAVKKWIDDGAVWTLDEVDPAIYVHSGQNHNFVQRLTINEYIETVEMALGVDIEKEARQLLPVDLRADGFSNTAYNLNVDLKHVEVYSKLAEIVVSRLDVNSFVKQFSNRRKFTDSDMEDVISKLGRWLLRGPVSEREVIAYRGITTTVASAGGNFEEAMGFVIEAMLQSPRFIYRVENQRGSGGLAMVDNHELASRLSFIIWGGPPDKELAKLADSGSLSDELQKQVARMLGDPRAVQQSLRFVSDWLNVNRLGNLSPNERRFPEWDARLAEDMRQETLAYFEEVVWTQNKPLSALMNSQVTFASPALARFYGLPDVPSNAKTTRMDLSAVPGRGGLLTQGSVLTVGGDDASMVTRGLLVMHELLRGVVKDPPPCVDTTPVPTQAGVTQRTMAMERINDASCGGCHKRFEPLAFGLEKFDGLGAYHDKDEHGNQLRDDGDILVPGTAKAIKYGSAAELMDLLAKSDRVSQSLTWKVTQFALGRPLIAEDAAIVSKLHEESQANGGTWSAVITAIVTSDLVQKTRTTEGS